MEEDLGLPLDIPASLWENYQSLPTANPAGEMLMKTYSGSPRLAACFAAARLVLGLLEASVAGAFGEVERKVLWWDDLLACGSPRLLSLFAALLAAARYEDATPGLRAAVPSNYAPALLALLKQEAAPEAQTLAARLLPLILDRIDDAGLRQCIDAAFVAWQQAEAERAEGPAQKKNKKNNKKTAE